MEWLSELWAFVQSLDERILVFIDERPVLFFVCFAAIIFAETGLIVTAFLPAETLVFSVATIAATGEHVNPLLIIPIAALATAGGDLLNMHIGRWFGHWMVRKHPGRVFNERNLAWCERYFERYGRWTVALCRFAPLIRTVAPFMAGMSDMRVGTFVAFNGSSALVWASLFVGAGIWFGQIPGIADHLTWVVAGIAVVAMLPMLIQFWHTRRMEAQRVRAQSADTEDGDGP